MSEGSGPGLAAQPSAPQELPERRWSGGSGVYAALVAGAVTASPCSRQRLRSRRSGAGAAAAASMLPWSPERLRPHRAAAWPSGAAGAVMERRQRAHGAAAACAWGVRVMRPRLPCVSCGRGSFTRHFWPKNYPKKFLPCVCADFRRRCL